MRTSLTLNSSRVLSIAPLPWQRHNVARAISESDQRNIRLWRSCRPGDARFYIFTTGRDPRKHPADIRQ